MACRAAVICTERDRGTDVTLFVVRIWGGQYREELILNDTVFVVRVWGGQYRDIMEVCSKL